MLETVLNSPGLQHLAKEIFWNLNSNALESCSQINQSSKQILENPFFWLEKLVRFGIIISKKNHEDWTKAIQSVRYSAKKKHVLAYLKWNLKKEEPLFLKSLGFPCYTNPIAQDEFRNRIWKSYKFQSLSHGKKRMIFKLFKKTYVLHPLWNIRNCP